MTVNRLLFSKDDPLWVVRAPNREITNLNKQVPQWLAGIEEPECAMKLPLTQMAFHVHNSDTVGPDHTLVAGICGTSYVCMIAEEPVLSTLDFMPGIMPRNRPGDVFAPVQDHSVASLGAGTFDLDEYMQKLASRNIDITISETDKLAFIHFPLWSRTDLPEDATEEEVALHKQQYIDFTFAETFHNPHFLPSIISSIVESASRLSAQEANKKATLRSYDRYDDAFVQVESTRQISEFIFPKEHRCMPSVLVIPDVIDGRSCREACEMVVCEEVNGTWQCHVVVIKPYANCPDGS